MPDRLDADAIAEELHDCRQRGLDWLDHKSANQEPVQRPHLDELAEEYAAARRLAAIGPIGRIQTLLRDGITEFAGQGRVVDADLLRDLFFGATLDGPIRPAGVLLKEAQERFGETDSRFRERRNNVMRSFAGFLIDLVAAPLAMRVSADGHWDQATSFGYVSGSERFIRLLASAVNATIVGITNDRLRDMLEQALQLKSEPGRPDAFWHSLRIVFLGRGLLDFVSDERDSSDPAEKRGQRRQEAVWARTSIWDMLKRTHSTGWELYESPSMLQLNGALLEFDDGRKLVHLVIRRSRLSRAEHVYLEFDDVGGRFAAIFEDIIRDCASANLVVPIGFPAGQGFRCRGARNQAKVLVDSAARRREVGRPGSRDAGRADGWLPMVLVVTPQRNGSEVRPIMQLRTGVNAARELGRVSHLAGHILEEDRERPGGKLLDSPTRYFERTDPAPLSAVQRVVQEVSADDYFSAIDPMGTGRYLYPDKEHLYFFIYALELPEDMRFPNRAEMRAFRLDELLTIRGNQVLSSAAQLCRLPRISAARREVTAEIISLNLCLHDQPELADRLLGLPDGDPDELELTATAMEEKLEAAPLYPSVVDPSQDIEVTGLAGWQHREFFSVLLEIYVKLGITGARELQAEIEGDPRKAAAVRRLAELYGNVDKMASTPMEL
jgi:hypothetical protein